MSTTIETLRFKNDNPMRKRLFVADAFAHPAKGHIALWQEMVLRYSKEGDTLLDPMAGIGTSLVAALMGRNVVCVELEAHFVDPMRRSWEKMRNMPMLGYTMGEATIIQGDARNLGDVLADCVVTSPPYEQMGAGEGPGAAGPNSGMWKGSFGMYSSSNTGYTRPVDAIVTSPPYDHATAQLPGSRGGKLWAEGARASQEQIHLDYSGSITNIGNLRNTAYWDAMRQVYAECYRCLKPGGIMALVLKGFTRAGVYVNLPEQTEALLLKAGWQKHDHWRRELWSLSFWRILQKRRDPAAFDERLMYEEVLAFRKPDGKGKGVDAVLTSPPYEAVVGDHKEGPGAGSNEERYGRWAKDTANEHGGYVKPVDAIITSPPYEALSFTGDSKQSQSANEEKWGRRFGPAYRRQSYTKEVK